ncbi:MAG: phosphatidate cytidylyltransferase [Chloroflexota bacterium]
MLAQRLLTAAVGIPVIAALIYFGGHVFTGVVCAILAIAAIEFVQMMLGGDDPLWRPSPIALIAAGGVVALPIAVDAGVEWPPELLFVAVVTMAYVMVRGLPVQRPAWAVALAAVWYIGLLGSYFVLLRDLDDDGMWVFLAVLSTWGTDTCAYAVGRTIGRHKMAPRISPGKTWEGTAGALIGGLVVVVALGLVLDLPVTLGESVLLGLVLPAVAVVADLGESVLKRGAGVKDTSVLVPGHGGFLDRLDSLLFTVPLVYYFAMWVVL